MEQSLFIQNVNYLTKQMFMSLCLKLFIHPKGKLNFMKAGNTPVAVSLPVNLKKPLTDVFSLSRVFHQDATISKFIFHSTNRVQIKVERPL